jgi:hypothetical protein
MAMPFVAGGDPDATPVERARYLLLHRHLDGCLDSACQLLAQFRAAEPTGEQGLALWIQVNLALGDIAQGRSAKLACLERALAAADTLRRLNGLNAEGHLWWAVARGLAGQQYGMLNSLWMLPSVRRELKRALELDTNCLPAHTGLGVLYWQVPRFLGGNRDTSRYYFETGLGRFPNATDTRLWLAKLDIAEGKRNEARCQLNILLATEDPLDPAGFFLSDQPEAQRLLRRLGPR